jgi:hypothetical protein
MDAFLQNLLLPVLGGFIFVVVHYQSRQTFFVFASGEKLLLTCASIGVGAKLLLLLGATIADLWLPGVYAYLTRDNGAFPVIDILALLVIVALALCLNLWTDPETAYRNVLSKVGGELERTIDRAGRDRKPLMLSLFGGRVYVGMVTSTRPRALGGTAPSYLRIIPLMSGYRVPLSGDPAASPKPGGVVFTTYYEDAVATVLDASSYAASEITFESDDGRTIKFDPRDIAIIVPIGEIETASLFDPRVYAYLNRERDPEGWKSLSNAPEPQAIHANSQAS